LGGIYRDCWLYTTADVHVTDVNQSATQSGGGVFVQYEYANKSEALIKVKTEVANDSPTEQRIVVENQLFGLDAKSGVKARVESSVTLKRFILIS